MINLTILFANDDVLTQWVMSEVLAEAGFGVVSACRAGQVIDLLEDAQEFDILLADPSLPDSAGSFDVGIRWHDALPGRPVIYTAATQSALNRPLRLGESFLATPFSASELLQTIDRALEDAWFRPLAATRSSDLHQVH